MKILKFLKIVLTSSTTANTITIIASVFAIVGISIVSTVGPLYSNSTSYRRNNQEKIIQTINVNENKDYLDNVLGVPKMCIEIDIPLIDGNVERGHKAIYSNEFYTLIGYFKEDMSLFGYFIINKDPKFNPILYRGRTVFKTKLLNFDISREKLLAYNLNAGRNDTSSYYIKFSHHHLATFDCFIGLGISSLGYLSDNACLTRKIDNGESSKLIYQDDELFRYLDKEQIDFLPDIGQGKINTFANFKNDRDIYLLILLKEEFYNKLGITYAEYCYLNDNIN